MKDNRLTVDFSATGSFEELDYMTKFTVRRAIEATLMLEGFDRDAEVSVTFCDNSHIKKLNKKYRDKDKATDVLSFPMYDFSEGFDADEADGELLLGDIVISVERAKEQAEEVGNPFLREIAFLTVHSMLHLLGYDHEASVEDDEEQCEAQREIMAVLDEGGLFECEECEE